LNDDQIVAEREEKFATLLFEISQILGYKFGRTAIRDNIYRPQFHNQVDEIELETRTRVLDLLRSDALPIRFVSQPAAAPTPTAPVLPERLQIGE
jgi:hypothetical protein